jgi:uncharacterized sporulation protein YeaH/YhbH (DUF444 family)
MSYTEPRSRAGLGAQGDTSLAERVREMESQLRRERARNQGLERGLSALSVRVETLRRENAAQRSMLDGGSGAPGSAGGRV